MATFIDEPEYYVNPYYNLQYILNTPAMTVPALSDEDIEVSILQAIFGYFKEDISLEALVALAETIQLFMGMREKRHELSDLLNKIKELSLYVKSPAADTDTIDTVLTEVFERITKESHSH